MSRKRGRENLEKLRFSQTENWKRVKSQVEELQAEAKRREDDLKTTISDLQKREAKTIESHPSIFDDQTDPPFFNDLVTKSLSGDQVDNIILTAIALDWIRTLRTPGSLTLNTYTLLSGVINQTEDAKDPFIIDTAYFCSQHPWGQATKAPTSIDDILITECEKRVDALGQAANWYYHKSPRNPLDDPQRSQLIDLIKQLWAKQAKEEERMQVT